MEEGQIRSLLELGRPSFLPADKTELLVLKSSGLDWNCTTSFLWPPAHKAGNGTSQTLLKPIPVTNLYTSIRIPLILFLWRIPTNTDGLSS